MAPRMITNSGHVRTPSGLSNSARLGILGLTGLASACSSDSFQMELVHTAPETDPMAAHASAYLDTRLDFSEITATLDCPELTSVGCLLTLEGRSSQWEGEGRSLVLRVATEAQPLPGDADLAASYLEPWKADPVLFVAQEEVLADELAERYHYTCTYQSGTITFFDKPVVGERVTGQLQELAVACTQQTSSTVVPALLSGTFDVQVNAPLNPTVIPDTARLQ